jgi:tetratricopeptide (TPR) repeat protein
VSTARENGSARLPARIRLVAASQIALAIVALAISVFVGMKIQPLIEEERRLRGEVESAQVELAQARRDIESTQERLKSSREAVSWVTNGINAYHQGQYREAVALYGRALNLDPENPYIHNLRGYSLFKLKEFDDAIAAQKRAVEVDPRYGWGYFDLARVLCAAERFEEASAAVRQALAIRPDLRGTMSADGEFSRLCRPIAAEFR